MLPLKKDLIETVFCIILRISMLSSESNYLYDCQQHKLVFSTKGCVYSVAVHVTIAIVSMNVLPRLFIEHPFLKGRAAPQLLYKTVIATSFIAIGLNLFSHWTGRARAPKLIHKMNQIRLRDFQNCAKVERKILMMIYLKIALMFVLMTNIILSSFQMDGDILKHIYLTFLGITMTVGQFQHYMGLAYAQYLFKLTNWRLSEIVDDINCGRRMSRKKSRALRIQLTRLGRTHMQLRRLTLKFKDLFQAEIISNLIAYFMAVVFKFFNTLIVGRSAASNLSERLAEAGTSVLTSLDFLSTFWMSGDVARSCNASAEIMKEISSVRALDPELEASIEVLCFQLKTEKMHLTVCGMFNLDEAGLKTAKAALLHYILMIQMDYDNF